VTKGYAKQWDEMTTEETSAVATLGYTQETWDDENNTYNVFGIPWGKLTRIQRSAAKILGAGPEQFDGYEDTPAAKKYRELLAQEDELERRQAEEAEDVSAFHGKEKSGTPSRYAEREDATKMTQGTPEDDIASVSDGSEYDSDDSEYDPDDSGEVHSV
jgi:hypothetical protein